MQTNRTVHMVTDGNGNGVVMEWVVDPFSDGNGNGKNPNTSLCKFAIAVAVTQCEHYRRKEELAVAVAVTQCERALSPC